MAVKFKIFLVRVGVNEFIKLARENHANKETKFYLYASWPFLWTGKPLQTAWSMATKDELTTAKISSKKSRPASTGNWSTNWTSRNWVI